MNPRRTHQSGTRVLSSLLVVVGVVLMVQAVVADTRGGLVARLVLGVLFVAAGAGRLYVLARTASGDGRGPDAASRGGVGPGAGGASRSGAGRRRGSR